MGSDELMLLVFWLGAPSVVEYIESSVETKTRPRRLGNILRCIIIKYKKL